MPITRIAVPPSAKKGEVIEIKTLIQHNMETGHRRDNMGRPIPRDIIDRLVVTYEGAEIFRADIFSGVAANPYFAFLTIATRTSDVVFQWTDDKGETITERRKLTVA